MNANDEQIHMLEPQLVQEFRACQALYRLMQEERLALVRGQASELLSVAERKEAALNRVARLDAKRQEYLGADGNDLKTREALTDLDPAEAKRLLYLQEGILALLERVREQARLNRSLALSALDRASAMQNELMGLYRGIPAEKPHLGTTGATSGESRPDLPAVMDALVAARRALDTGDNMHVAQAINNLQSALDEILGYLDTSGRYLTPADSHVQELVGEPEAVSNQNAASEHTSVVEMIADLHRQGSAYQAVLSLSNRMLAGA